ncbi:MAG TPA: hypothetical protein VMT15_13035 [Bryobacteraceae bacterium]|nr:hypothetical protein [Bryobacteraceae bacterium]
MAILWALVAPVLGCLLVYRFSGLKNAHPRWAAWLLVFGAGTCAGVGLASCLFFLMHWAVPGVRVLPMIVEIALLAFAGYEVYRIRTQVRETESTPNVFLLPLAGAAILGLIGATAVMSIVWDANPEGNWDAWSIWNLRARMFTSDGALAQRAWSPVLTGHPEYPLLTSGYIARSWNYAQTPLDNVASAVPIVTSYLFFAALLAMASGGVAALRSRALGLLFGLALLASPNLLAEVPAQYADVPLASFFLGAVVCWLLDEPVLAGVLASLAAWTKDEGLFFLAAFAVFALVFRRARWPRWIAGAIPTTAIVLLIKFGLARGSPSLVGGSSLSKVFAFGRSMQVMAGFVSGFAGMMVDWYHPLLPAIVLAVALRFQNKWKRDVLFPGGISLAMLAGYLGVYLAASNDLSWQLQTSMNRLLVQIWPLLLLTIFMTLRAPESMVTLIEPKQKPVSKRKK